MCGCPRGVSERALAASWKGLPASLASLGPKALELGR